MVQTQECWQGNKNTWRWGSMMHEAPICKKALCHSVKMLRSPSDPRSIPYHSPNSHPNHPPRSLTLCYHSPEPQLTPKNPDTISSPSKNPNWSPRPLITFQSLLFCFSPLALCSHFHVPVSVSIFPFSIDCTISVLLLSCSGLHSTIVHLC